MLDAITGFHLELTNICTLKCPRCARTEFIDMLPTKWKNKNLKLADLQNFLDINLTDKKFLLCGTYGDPIYSPEIFEIVSWLKSQGAVITIETNGSYKTKGWWEELVSKLDNRDQVSFSIDGTPDNFTNYRVNADWNSIKIGIDVTTSSVVKTAWKFIRFSYNEYDIETVKQLSSNMGFDSFELIESDRWIENDLLKPSQMAKEKIVQWVDKDTKINPACLNKNNMHYITADGFYLPCCYVAGHQFLFKTSFWKNRIDYDIRKSTISNILENKTKNFYTSLLEDKHDYCRFNCSEN